MPKQKNDTIPAPEPPIRVYSKVGSGFLDDRWGVRFDQAYADVDPERARQMAADAPDYFTLEPPPGEAPSAPAAMPMTIDAAAEPPAIAEG